MLACSDADGSEYTVKDFPNIVARTECDRAMRCGTGVSERSYDACVELMAARVEDGPFVREDSVEQGRLTFHAERVDPCLAALEASSCEDLREGQSVAACEDIFQGTVAEGDECNFNYECKKGLVCEQASFGCGGTCEHLVTTVEECDPEVEDCDDEEPVAALLKEGDPCDAGEARDRRVCERDLACVPIFDAEGGASATCKKRVAGGRACNAGYPEACEDGFYCSGTFDDSNGEGECLPLPTRGEACVGRDQPCAVGLICMASGKCEAPRRLGESCEEASECASYACIGGRCQRQGLCE